MLFGLRYEIGLNNMDGLKPTAVSGVLPAKTYVPAGATDDSERFNAYSVVVSYPGDLMKCGNVKRKLAFRPGNKIGMVGYNGKKNITDVKYLFGDNKYFFPEDAYHAASMFACVMSCRAMRENVKQK